MLSLKHCFAIINQIRCLLILLTGCRHWQRRNIQVNIKISCKFFYKALFNYMLHLEVKFK